jgi:hypothetical protein
LNLKSPSTFNEKIQWLKLYGNGENFPLLADKYLVRDYVKNKIGRKYLIEIFSVFDDVDSISLENLPDRFVLKATHGSGWNIFCKDIRLLDIDAVRDICQIWLNTNYYKIAREPVYKKISPKILCEKYLDNNQPGGILDYKFFCFHGKVKFIQVDIDRYIDHKRNIFDPEWNFLPVDLKYPRQEINQIRRPEKLLEMIKISETLADDFPFARIDLYWINQRIYFSEITFYPGGGFEVFNPPEWDIVFGKHIDLNQNT